MKGIILKIKGLINTICWNKVSNHPSLKYYFQRSEKPFESDIPTFENEQLNSSFLDDNRKWFHNEFIIDINEPSVVEPTYGNVIIGQNKILKESIYFPKLVPSFTRFLLNKISKKRVVMENAILFDVFVGENYFHFFSDIINKIWLLENYALTENRPLIIGESIYSLEYFQFFLNNKLLKEKNWYVLRRNEYLKVNRLTICRAMPYDLKYWKRTISLFELQKNKKRRIFLNRSPQSGRNIVNVKEIEPILLKYNFEIIDTLETSIEYQKNLFSETEFIIAIHGAGETNSMFSCNNNLRLLEIIPSNRIACHYYWLSLMFNFRYDCIVGGELIKNRLYNQACFNLNPDILESAINKMNTYNS